MLELEDGTVTMIDREDVGRVAGYSWHLIRSGGIQMPVTTVCSQRRICEEVFLNRLIANAGPDDIVYHRNHDTLDNRRDNLVVLARDRAPIIMPNPSVESAVAD
jgi:hypothetical protein